jgi:hypothetical protein
MLRSMTGGSCPRSSGSRFTTSAAFTKVLELLPLWPPAFRITSGACGNCWRLRERQNAQLF